LAAETTYDHPLIALDILPTACEAAGAAIPDDIDGVSLLPQLTKTEPDPSHPSLCWRFGPQKAIRQGDWKLVDWRDFNQSTSSGWELYNLREDIGEAHNRAMEHPELAARLRGEWESWNQRNVEPAWRGSKTEDPPLSRPPESTDPLPTKP
jgi:arylsulfatase A-like enzyme